MASITAKKVKRKRELTNLYDEIMSHLKEGESEVHYVVMLLDKWGDNPRYVTFEDRNWFLEQAKRIDYDSSYGSNVIDLELKIVLKNGDWLERVEYDGSEGWVRKTRPPCPEEYAKKDIALLFEERHRCPHNEATIDGKSILSTERFSDRGKYYLWFEKEKDVVIEEHKWSKGNYKKKHKKFVR